MYLWPSARVLSEGFCELGGYSLLSTATLAIPQFTVKACAKGTSVDRVDSEHDELNRLRVEHVGADVAPEVGRKLPRESHVVP